MTDPIKIRLRLISEEDFDSILSWENNPIYWSISGTQVPFTKDLIRAYVNDSQDVYKAKQVRFIICAENNDLEVYGCIDIFEFDPNHLRAGVGILLNPEARGKGIGRSALSLLEKYAKAQLNIKNLHCSILANNEKSIQLFNSSGFKKTGVRSNWTKVNGEWIDEILYQKEI